MWIRTLKKEILLSIPQSPIYLDHTHLGFCALTTVAGVWFLLWELLYRALELDLSYDGWWFDCASEKDAFVFFHLSWAQWRRLHCSLLLPSVCSLVCVMCFTALVGLNVVAKLCLKFKYNNNHVFLHVITVNPSFRKSVLVPLFNSLEMGGKSICAWTAVSSWNWHEDALKGQCVTHHINTALKTSL